MERRHLCWVYLGAGLAGVSVVFWISARSVSSETIFEPAVRLVEPAPMCPWREPELDLQRCFPEATGYRTETRLLSGKRIELQQSLGRMPATEEHSLQVHRVLRDHETLGTILTRRVKGEHGAIEIVLMLSSNLVVHSLRLQRLREPESVAESLQSHDWLAAFAGKGSDADWRLGRAIPDLPDEARISGQRIVDGARSLLILMRLSEEHPPPQRH